MAWEGFFYIVGLTWGASGCQSPVDCYHLGCLIPSLASHPSFFCGNDHTANTMYIVHQTTLSPSGVSMHSNKHTQKEIETITSLFFFWHYVFVVLFQVPWSLVVVDGSLLVRPAGGTIVTTLISSSQTATAATTENQLNVSHGLVVSVFWGVFASPASEMLYYKRWPLASCKSKSS